MYFIRTNGAKKQKDVNFENFGMNYWSYKIPSQCSEVIEIPEN